MALYADTRLSRHTIVLDVVKALKRVFQARIWGEIRTYEIRNAFLCWLPSYVSDPLPVININIWFSPPVDFFEVTLLFLEYS